MISRTIFQKFDVKDGKSTALERHDRVLQRSAKRRCLEEQLQRSVEISDNNEDECRLNSSLSDDDEGSHRDLEESQRIHRATQTNKVKVNRRTWDVKRFLRMMTSKPY